MPGKKDGDVVMILTTDTIIKVMEAYLNEHELRRKVQVVNLQAKGDAYAFSLEYIEDTDQQPTIDTIVGKLGYDHYNKILENAASVEQIQQSQPVQHQYGIDITDGGWKERQVPITQQTPLSKEDAAWLARNSKPVHYQHTSQEYADYKAGTEYTTDTIPHPRTPIDWQQAEGVTPPVKEFITRNVNVEVGTWNDASTDTGTSSTQSSMLGFDISQETPGKVIAVKRNKNGQFVKADKE